MNPACALRRTKLLRKEASFYQDHAQASSESELMTPCIPQSQISLSSSANCHLDSSFTSHLFAPLCMAVSWGWEGREAEDAAPASDRFTISRGKKASHLRSASAVGSVVVPEPPKREGWSGMDRAGEVPRASGPWGRNRSLRTDTAQTKTQGTLGWRNRTCLRWNVVSAGLVG